MPGNPRIYLVFPDLGGAKAEALCKLSRRGFEINVLVSYFILKTKPITYQRLISLREKSCLRNVMLDSGAYHIAFHGLELTPEEYALRAKYLRNHVNLIVGPDIPRNPEKSIDRMLRFSNIYKDEFIPTLQSSNLDPEEYLLNLEALEVHGLLKKAPKVHGGKPLIGIGGLVGVPVKIVASVIDRLKDACNCFFHLFGANVRIIKGLARRDLLNKIYSIDTSGWLSDLRWRRRTVYKARDTLEANIKVMIGYLAKIQKQLLL